MVALLLDLASNGIVRAGPGTIFVYLLVMTQLTIFTVTLYLHRSQTHRSVDFHPALTHAFRFWSWLTTAMVTREWVAVHRMHHAHSDTEQDPHSPHVLGIGTLLFKGTELYAEACRSKELLTKYGRGTPDDWIERHVYTPHCNCGPTVLAIVDLALFGVGGMAIWAIQMMWIPFWAAGVVNGIGHWWGYRNFETADRSANLIPWAMWVGGEELHNNHHAFPSSAKFSMRRFEFDLGWLVIQMLAGLKLAHVKRVACADRKHPEYHAIKGPQHATLAPRVWAMTEYFRKVMLPAVRDETRRCGATPSPSLSLRLRRALADGGRWLTADDRVHLNAWIDARPCLRTLCEFRTQLAALMEQRDVDVGSDGLSRWAHAAEVSGIGSLQTFAASLLANTIATR
ncbi:DesA family fatty acid desaturase [Dokdonella soli]